MWSCEPLLYAVGDAKRVGDDGQGRVHRADGRKKARIRQIEVVELVRLAVEIEHGGLGVGSETRGAGLMGGAAERDILSQIERALEEDGVVAGFVQNLFQLALEARKR